MPSLTVCLAVYNGAETLPKALESVYAQTYKDFDVLVLDDGSKDDSAEVARSFGARVVRQENTGLGGARRRMMEEATGDLVAFIDHDDEWFPNKLEVQVPVHLKHNAVLSHHAMRYEYMDGRKEDKIFDFLKPDTPPAGHLVPENWILPTGTIMDRRAVLDGGNFIAETRYCSDWYGFFIVADKGPFVYLPEVLGRYIMRPGQNSTYSWRWVNARRYVLEEHILPRLDEFLSDVPAAKRQEYRRDLQKTLQYIKHQLANFKREERDPVQEFYWRRDAEMCVPGAGAYLRVGKAWLGMCSRLARKAVSKG